MQMMGVESARRWGPLTAELDRAASPIKTYFHTRFPNIADLQRRYREDAGRLIVAGSNPLPGTIGAAFDWSVRFLVHPQPALALAVKGADRLSVKLGAPKDPRLALAIAQLAKRLGVEMSRTSLISLGVPTFVGPARESAVSEDLLLRGCWALALLAEVFRMGPVPLPLRSPLRGLDLETIDGDALLDLATPDALAEISELRSVARHKLLPHLAERTGLWAVGPTFEGSKLMPADADLVADGLLVELKTGLGAKLQDGTRRCRLDAKVLYQMIGYALLDFDDSYQIDSIGLYEARYGHLAIWKLQDLLDETAPRQVHIAHERERLRALLDNDQVGRSG